MPKASTFGHLVSSQVVDSDCIPLITNAGDNKLLPVSEARTAIGPGYSSTVNAFNETGATTIIKIQAAIARAVSTGADRVFVPTSMLPYAAASVTFNATIQMVREGGSFDVFDVLAYGAYGDGLTDDTAAVQACCNAAATRGRDIVYPVGDYRCTTSVSITVGLSMVGMGVAGAVSASVVQPYAALIHDFNGDFFVCDGSGGSERGSGLKFENIVFVQKYGTSGSTCGTPIVCTGTSLTARVNWLRIIDCSFEKYLTGVADWTRCVDVDGSGVGGGDGIRDVWMTNIRMNSGPTATSCLRLKSVFNYFGSGIECTGGSTTIEITGTAGSPSSSINFANCTSGVVALDYCQNVSWSGGGLTAITGTANTGTECDFRPGRVTNAIPATGAFTAGNIHVQAWNATDVAQMFYDNLRLPNGKAYQGRTSGGGGVSLIYVDSVDHVIIDPGQVGCGFGINATAPGAGAAATLSTIGGTGPATAAQNGWQKFYDGGGTAYWVPIWR